MFAAVSLVDFGTNENCVAFLVILAQCAFINHRVDQTSAVMTNQRPIVPSFLVQEEGSQKVLVYLDIPELKVKRTFPNVMKKVPKNGDEIQIDFQQQSLNFSLRVQSRNNDMKRYVLCVRRLPGEIRPERCSIEYQRGGCWITLIKLQPMNWMNRICDDINPGLDSFENEEQSSNPSAPPAEEKKLRDTEMPAPYNLVPLAPPPYSSGTKKGPAPPPPQSSRST